MGNSKVLTVLALIIGFVGMGVGGYSLYAIQTGVLPDIASLEDDVGDTEDDIEDVEDVIGTIPTTVIKGVWYDNELNKFNIPSKEDTEIPGLSVNITVRSGEKVYISFSCFAEIASGNTYVYFWTCVDGTKTSPEIKTYAQNVAAFVMGESIAMQGVVLLSAGTHKITIWCRSTDASSFCDEKHLYVYTYV